LKNFFAGAIPSALRIAQLLGLPPTDAQNKVCFLEMPVSTKDFFRPAPDPEITDHEAEIDSPSTQYGTPFRTYNTTELMFAD
jgi:hypothetical protein